MKGNQFTSIEKDMKPLGMRVQHTGMTEREALQLVGDISDLGIDAMEQAIPGTGTKRYERETRGHSPLARERFYTLEDARYHVSVTYGGKSLLLENRGQWEYYKRRYLPTSLVKIKVDDSLDNSEVGRKFFALTGSTLSEAFKDKPGREEDTSEYETEEVSDDALRMDIYIFESAIEEGDLIANY